MLGSGLCSILTDLSCGSRGTELAFRLAFLANGSAEGAAREELQEERRQDIPLTFRRLHTTFLIAAAISFGP